MLLSNAWVEKGCDDEGANFIAGLADLLPSRLSESFPGFDAKPHSNPGIISLSFFQECFKKYLQKIDCDMKC